MCSFQAEKVIPALASVSTSQPLKLIPAGIVESGIFKITERKEDSISGKTSSKLHCITDIVQSSTQVGVL